MNRLSYFILLILILFLACTRKTEGTASGLPTSSEALTFAQKVEEAHQLSIWQSKQALSFDIALYFRGKGRLIGNILMETNFSRIKITANDGSVMVFKDQQAYVHPADSKFRTPRFDLLTWPYFLAVPFKLSDPGGHMSAIVLLSIDSL